MLPPRLRRLLTVPPLLLIIGSLASADAITGRVVDANGVGVAGVDIDFVNLGSGGNPHEQNDGTDANGNFLTTVDAGVYEVRFFPPAPPATTLLTGKIASVVVVGTKNVGTITLVSGFALQGTIANPGNQPVSGVKIEVFESATGAPVLLKNNTTGAFGTFALAVPGTDLRLDLRTNAVVGQVLVPRRLSTTVSAPTNLGTLALQAGFHVTGTARTQSGAAVSGADLDVTDVPTGDKLFTPGDTTTSTGLFDVVLPAGTFDFEIARPPSQVLVGAAQNGVVVSGTANLGTFTLRNGVFLSGTVRDRKNAVVAGADVNVHEVATGLPIALGADNTNAAGFYSVVVPLGLMNVVFSPPGPNNALEKDRHDGVEILANTTLDGRLPGTPPGLGRSSQSPHLLPPILLPLGRGTPGTGGAAPVLTGATSAGTITLRVFGGRPGAAALLVLGTHEGALRSHSDVHLVRQPALRIPLALDAEGYAEFTLSRADVGMIGRTTFAQFAVYDPAAVQGLALSQLIALSITD